MLSAVLYLGAGICLFWGRFASALTQDGLGEPIVLFEGVSIWPTVALRILGILLSLHLIWLSKALLEKNLESIAMDRKLTHAHSDANIKPLTCNDIIHSFSFLSRNDKDP